MGSYSPERKAAVLARMLPPHSQSVYQISRQEGIPVNTLYGWRSQAGISTQQATDDAAKSQPSGCLLESFAKKETKQSRTGLKKPSGTSSYRG